MFASNHPATHNYGLNVCERVALIWTHLPEATPMGCISMGVILKKKPNDLKIEAFDGFHHSALHALTPKMLPRQCVCHMDHCPFPGTSHWQRMLIRSNGVAL